MAARIKKERRSTDDSYQREVVESVKVEMSTPSVTKNVDKTVPASEDDGSKQIAVSQSFSVKRIPSKLLEQQERRSWPEISVGDQILLLLILDTC
jgi:hypothetical protein